MYDNTTMQSSCHIPQFTDVNHATFSPRSCHIHSPWYHIHHIPRVNHKTSARIHGQETADDISGPTPPALSPHPRPHLNHTPQTSPDHTPQTLPERHSTWSLLLSADWTVGCTLVRQNRWRGRGALRDRGERVKSQGG